MALKLEQVLAHYPPHVSRTIEEFRGRFKQHRSGVYGVYDWNRVGFAAGLAVGASVLDVGAGNGALLTMLHASGAFARVCGIDVRDQCSRSLPRGVDYRLGDVTKLEFADAEFDTVICMEVIEHLPVEAVAGALAELRRVARRRLLMTVPYEEPYPLYHHDRPSGHKQRFDAPRLAELFPRAIATTIPERRVDWALLAEDGTAHRDGFELLAAPLFCTRLAGPPALVPPRATALERLRRALSRVHAFRAPYLMVKSLALRAARTQP